MNILSDRSKSNKTIAINPDSENLEEPEKTSRKKPIIKNKKSKSKTKKRNQSSKGVIKIPNLPNLIKLEKKLEEKEEIEFILGDFNTFHKLNEIQTFENMTSLTLINESIKSITSIVENLPYPEKLKFLCLNQNEIDVLDGIDKLINLQNLQINFNNIDKIPKFFSSLKHLHTFWISDNNISILENIPINLKSFWIANNEIEIIPNDFGKYEHLENLNISGNYIDDLKDLYILGKIKTLKRIYLSDINFGENPICQFDNYRKIMVNIFNYVDIIDQVRVTIEERKEVEKFFNDNVAFNKDKINQNYKLCKMVFRLMKTYKFFFLTFELYKIKILSLKLKSLIFNIINDNNLINNNLDTNIENSNNTNNKEIENIKNEIDNSLLNCENMNNIFYKLKKIISNLNDIFIVFNFYKLETSNNIEIEPGNLMHKWVMRCKNLMKEQLSEEFLKKYQCGGISINQIYKIKNKKSKFLFNSIYDDLLDEYDKFGEDKKFYKYLYLILYEGIDQDKRKLFNYLFESNDQEDNFFFCDNYSYIDEFLIKKKINENENIYNNNPNINNGINDLYTSILCKCAYFENSVEVIDGRFNFFFSIQEIKSYLINLKSNSTKEIICLKLKNNVNIYYYNNRGLIHPKYIIEYNYKTLQNNFFLNGEINRVSSFDEQINFNEENEKLYNTCAKHFFKSKNKIVNFINKETLNKYSLSKFFEYKELDNNFLFFIKNTLFTYLNNCFKYNNEEEFFKEIESLNEKKNEINKYKNENNFLNLYDNWIANKNLDNKENRKNNEEEKNFYENNQTNTATIKNKFLKTFKISNLKCINLFNLNLNDNSIIDILNKIKRGINKYNEILQLVENCEELSLSSNNLNKIELSEILKIFPNLCKLDISHNNISAISYTTDNLLLNINKSQSLINIDISYNNISDFNIIIMLLKLFNLSEFNFFPNPFDKKFYKLMNYKQNNIINYEIRQSIMKKYDDLTKNDEEEKKINEKIKFKYITKTFDYIYNCYSFSDEYNSFNDCIYFQNQLKYSNESQNNIIYLNNKNLKSIPVIKENNKNNIRIIYLNSNKIIKIENLSNFSNLTELFLQNNKIKVIKNLPISIIKLDLSNNFISNLIGIEKYKNLEWINLENNNIKIISPIIKLSNIIELYCANNYIDNFEDVSQLGKLKKLKILDISGNEIVNTIKNIRISIIYYCPNLKFLNREIVKEKERDMSVEFFTGKLTSDLLEKRIGENNANNLLELDLSSLKLKDEIDLFSKETYPKLKKLNISKNCFSSFIIFGSLPTLLELNLSYNMFVEIFPKNNKNSNEEKNKFNLQNLIFLDISGNQLVNLSGINYFSKLKKLNLKENSILKLDSIDKMNQLNYLNVSYNKLRSCDKTNIGILPALKIFICDNNYLKNINCFEKFYSIEILSFNSNKITDVGCIENLIQLKQLKHLSMINNPITKIENYRKIIIYMFQNLKVLDNKEILIEEKVINDNKNEYIKLYFENLVKDGELFGISNNNFVNNNSNFNTINNINNNATLFKKSNQKVNYIQLDYDSYPIKSNKFLSLQKDERKTKNVNPPPLPINSNLVQNQNISEIDGIYYLSKKNNNNKNIFPSIKKSFTTIKNKRDLSKVKYSTSFKNNNGNSLTSKGRYEKNYQRPQSSTRFQNNNLNKLSQKKLNKYDFYSFGLNSINNNNNYDPLITLKNWNLRKLNYYSKK